MGPPARSNVTQILVSLNAEETDREEANDRLFEAVYAELRRMADHLMQSERADHTLQPTALVHEAYLRLVDVSRVAWQDRSHFFRVAVRAMRRILVDHARGKAADKRGGDWARVTLDEASGLTPGLELEVIALDNALGKLAAMDERMSQLVEMRVFAGMEMQEIAHALGVSERTAYRDWEVAQRWLGRELDLSL